MSSVPNFYVYQLEIEDFDIPNNIKSISSCSFSDCHDLKSINIPSSVTQIDSFVFYGTTHMKDINFDGTKE